MFLTWNELGGLGNLTKCGKIMVYVGMSQVGLLKTTTFGPFFVIERLISLKLHYRRGVSAYTVLWVVKRFTFGQCISVNSALELV